MLVSPINNWSHLEKTFCYFHWKQEVTKLTAQRCCLLYTLLVRFRLYVNCCFLLIDAWIVVEDCNDAVLITKKKNNSLECAGGEHRLCNDTPSESPLLRTDVSLWMHASERNSEWQSNKDSWTVCSLHSQSHSSLVLICLWSFHCLPLWQTFECFDSPPSRLYSSMLFSPLAVWIDQPLKDDNTVLFLVQWVWLMTFFLCHSRLVSKPSSNNKITYSPTPGRIE